MEESFYYYKLPARTRLSFALEHLKNIFAFPGKVFKWWKRYVRISGFVPWLNLGKFIVLIVLSINAYIILIIPHIEANYTNISWARIIILWAYIIISSLIFFALSYAFILFKWQKWKDRSGRLDELWKQTGEELGLTLTMTRFSRRLTGIYKGVPLLITDRYTRTGLPFLSRRLSIVGRMAGVTVRSSEGQKIFFRENLKFTPLVFSNESWPGKFKDIREPLKQTIRNIMYFERIPSETYQFILSGKTFTFVHNAYSSNSVEDPCDKLSMTLKLVIEAYVMVFKYPELINRPAVNR